MKHEIRFFLAMNERRKSQNIFFVTVQFFAAAVQIAACQKAKKRILHRTSSECLGGNVVGVELLFLFGKLLTTNDAS